MGLEHRLGFGREAATAALEPAWSLVRSIAERCDATFVAAKWIEAKLERHGVPRVVRLPFGVDRSLFSPTLRSEAARRGLLGHGEGREHATLLVGAGRLAFEKRWDVVLDALERVHGDTRCVLALFGDGPERGAIEARVRASDLNVRILGFETDRMKLATAFASADLLVHGCPYETFGFAVAEAMSSGLPAVLPDAGGAAELADDAWSTRYAAGDARSCADAIRSMMARLGGDEREGLRKSAAKAAEKLPTVVDQFLATYEAYERLLADHGATGGGGLSLDW